MSENVLNIAVVGAGYWGKNLVRNFATAKRCNLKYVCDLNKKVLATQKKNFPFIKTRLLIYRKERFFNTFSNLRLFYIKTLHMLSLRFGAARIIKAKNKILRNKPRQRL